MNRSLKNNGYVYNFKDEIEGERQFFLRVRPIKQLRITHITHITTILTWIPQKGRLSTSSLITFSKIIIVREF